MHLIANEGMAEGDKIKQTRPYPVKAGVVYKQLSSALISSSNISTADSGLDSSRVLTSRLSNTYFFITFQLLELYSS